MSSEDSEHFSEEFNDVPMMQQMMNNNYVPMQMMNNVDMPMQMMNYANDIDFENDSFEQRNDDNDDEGLSMESRSDHRGAKLLVQEQIIKKKIRSIPLNASRTLNEQALKGYEKYVLAQFKFSTEAEILAERKAAIESLIPGTKAYFHLYFLDLVKQTRSMDKFTEEDKQLWERFDEKFGTTSEFYDVETQLLVLNRLEDKLPSDI